MKCIYILCAHKAESVFQQVARIVLVRCGLFIHVLFPSARNLLCASLWGFRLKPSTYCRLPHASSMSLPAHIS